MRKMRDPSDRGLSKLKRVETGEKTSVGQELVYRPGFGDFPFVQHDNFVGMLDGADPMGNNQHGSAVSELFKCILDHFF